MSTRKAFLLRIEIDIHSVACPGLRLCQSGNVAVKVHTLSSAFITLPSHPPLPIHIHETLVFEKVLDCVSNLSEIQAYLNKEPLKMEFLFWSGHMGETKLIADFRTKLSNLLFPRFLNKGVADGRRIRVLMETADKVGSVHPRVEVSTKIALYEKLSPEIPAGSRCHCTHTRSSIKRTARSDDRWTLGNDCCICNNYSGYFGLEGYSETRPRSLCCLRHRFTSDEIDKPIPSRHLFYENLEFFYRQLLNKRKVLNSC